MLKIHCIEYTFYIILKVFNLKQSLSFELFYLLHFPVSGITTQENEDSTTTIIWNETYMSTKSN